MIPPRGVHQRAAEVGQAVDVGQLRRRRTSPTALTTTSAVRRGGLPGAVQPAVPLPRVVVPADGAHRGAEHAGGDAGRSRRPPTRGRPGSRAAGRRCGSRICWARTRTSTGDSGCRRPHRDRCCAARCRRRRRRASMITRSSMPARRSATAAPRPPNPAPMIATLGERPTPDRRPQPARRYVLSRRRPARDLEPVEVALRRARPRGCRRIRWARRRRSCPAGSCASALPSRL